jgi:hypothetical protein
MTTTISYSPQQLRTLSAAALRSVVDCMTDVELRTVLDASATAQLADGDPKGLLTPVASACAFEIGQRLPQCQRTVNGQQCGRRVKHFGAHY